METPPKISIGDELLNIESTLAILRRERLLLDHIPHSAQFRPDCGKHLVRPADEDEQGEFTARMAELTRAEHPDSLRSTRFACSFGVSSGFPGRWTDMRKLVVRPPSWRAQIFPASSVRSAVWVIL